MPGSLEVNKETLSNTYAQFTAEPFERGFGATLGNAIRRVLLSSITGSAVTAVKIEGVHHELSSIPGVREDVTEIVLNIKSLRLKLHGTGPKTIYLRKRGMGVAVAKDITSDASVEIVTPDLVIATLDKNGNLNMQMTVEKGYGYVPASASRQEDRAIGTIPIDAIFSPVRRVNFTVESARLGMITDYDRLILEIETDGSVHPRAVLHSAAKILGRHLTLFVSSEDVDDEQGTDEKVAELTPKTLNMLNLSVTELELSARSMNCLKTTEIQTLGELVRKTEKEMLDTKNFGKKSLDEIKQALGTIGLSFGMKV